MTVTQIYTITKGASSNGSFTVSPMSAAEGDAITVTVTPDRKYVPGEFTYKADGGNPVTVSMSGTTATFSMPAGNVTVAAIFEQAGLFYKIDGDTLRFYAKNPGGTGVGELTGGGEIENMSPAWRSNNGVNITNVVFEEKIYPTTTSDWFNGCATLAVFQNMDNLVTDEVTNMERMFSGCSVLQDIDLSSFNTAQVTNMRNMFFNCTSLTMLDLRSFDTSRVTNMNYMFGGNSKLEKIRVADTFVITALYNTTQNSWMFQGCTSLKGKMGTAFDNNYASQNRAHIDEGQSNPGYFWD